MQDQDKSLTDMAVFEVNEPNKPDIKDFFEQNLQFDEENLLEFEKMDLLDSEEEIEDFEIP